MSEQAGELERRIRALTTRELERMLSVGAEGYDAEALALAEDELETRPLEDDEELAPVREELMPTWPGFALAGVTVATYIALFAGPPEPFLNTAFALSLFGGLAYWLHGVARLHTVLREATRDAYPIGPVRAVALHFVPIYNLYWVVRWPTRVSAFVRERLVGDDQGNVLVGILLLVLCAGLLPGNGLALAGMFAVLGHLQSRVREVLPTPAASATP